MTDTLAATVHGGSAGRIPTGVRLLLKSVRCRVISLQRSRVAHELPVRVGAGIAVLMGVALCAPLALAASPDGIELGLTDDDPSITLQWTGGTPPYEVYRGTLAPTVTDPAHKIADTGANSLVDLPPAGGIQYYLVTTASRAHPKLIIRESAFQSMRDRAAAEPWASMRADAIATSAAGYIPGGDNFETAQNLIRFSSASALAYILDPPNARVYATRVRDVVLNHTDDLAFGQDWGTVVPPANALFNLTLAVDVVFNQLTAGEVLAVETEMQQHVNQVWTGSWSSAGFGAIGTWDVYKGTRTTPDDAYYNSLMSGLSLDGVFYGGRCYGWARWTGNSRYARTCTWTWLEFTGVDRRYYQNPRIMGLYEWLYGHSDAVFGGPIPFGDCAIETARDDAFDEPPLYRAGKFGPVAARYAAVHLPAQMRGNLLSYVVPDGPIPAGAYASSKVYPDGGGFFMEAIPSKAARPTVMEAASGTSRASKIIATTTSMRSRWPATTSTCWSIPATRAGVTGLRGIRGPGSMTTRGRATRSEPPAGMPAG